MSGLVLPSFAPEETRHCVTQCLMAVPRLTRLLDTPGLLAAVCLAARQDEEPVRLKRLMDAANTPHNKLAADHGLSNLKILRRLTGDALTDGRIRRLQILFADRRALRFLWHARFVSSTLIDALATDDVRDHISSGFVSQLGNLRRRDLPISREVIELARFLREYIPNTSIRSLKHYDRLWDEHRSAILGHGDALRKPAHFPEPPWTDEPGYAVAIRTPRDLVAESVAMRNCVGMLPRFVRAIRRGKGYFFHVEGNWGMPKATLYCVKHGSHWRIDEAALLGQSAVGSALCSLLGVVAGGETRTER